MTRTTSQKVLKVLSIIDIVLSVFVIVLGGIMIAGGSLVAGLSAAELSGMDMPAGMTQMQLGAVSGWIGALVGFSGIVTMAQGVLGIRAAKDARKVKPVWVISLVVLALSVVSMASGFVHPETIGSAVVSLGGAAAMFWAANNVRHEAELLPAA